jgi:hypothetical protein
MEPTRTLPAWLESAGAGYVLAIAKSIPIACTNTHTARAEEALKMLIADDWVIESCGADSKGERRYAWTRIGTADPRRHPLIRRSLIPNAKGDPRAGVLPVLRPRARPRHLRTLIVADCAAGRTGR